MIFNEEQRRRLEHVASGKPVPKDEIDRTLPWDRLLTIDVPQDPRGTFKRPMTARIHALVARVKKHTSSAEGRVLAAGIEACIEHLTRMSTAEVQPDPVASAFVDAAKDLDTEAALRRNRDVNENYWVVPTGRYAGRRLHDLSHWEISELEDLYGQFAPLASGPLAEFRPRFEEFLRKRREGFSSLRGAMGLGERFSDDEDDDDE